MAVALADVADRKQVSAVLAAIPAALPLRGVVHSAGVLDDGIVLQQTPQRLAAVMSPKVAGAWNLHELTTDLDFFVLFSSVAGWLGNPGQSGYAAANTWLYGFAVWRRHQGLSATSLAWGPWSGGGMSQGLEQHMSRQGLSVIAPEAGLAMLEEALRLDLPMVGAFPWDGKALRQKFEVMPPLWRELLPERTRRQVAAASGPIQWKGLSSAQRAAVLQDTVRNQVDSGFARIRNPLPTHPNLHPGGQSGLIPDRPPGPTEGPLSFLRRRSCLTSFPLSLL